MTCEELSDRMPAVAGGAATWSQEEVEHLRTCADCRAEWAVVSAGRVVGAQASIDADSLAERVLQRLRTEPVVRRFPRQRWLVGLAAAAIIAIVLLPAKLPRSPAAPPSGGPAAPPLAVDVPGLDGLATGELADVLESLETSWTETSTSDAPSLEDLDPRELERMERSWEI
jgi:hypothetical protein